MGSLSTCGRALGFVCFVLRGAFERTNEQVRCFSHLDGWDGMGSGGLVDRISIDPAALDSRNADESRK